MEKSVGMVAVAYYCDAVGHAKCGGMARGNESADCVVVEEKSEMAPVLLKISPVPNLLQIHFLQLDDALHKLEQHELDSVFVIREGYEDNILANRRNQLIEAYSSNRSFAYRAVVETITSFAQQDASRTKAAFVIKQLFKDHGMDNDWSYSEIIANSQKRQQSEALLQSSFSFYTQEDVVESQSGPLLTVWGVWTLFAILTTFFLFDWVIQDNRPAMRPVGILRGFLLSSMHLARFGFTRGYSLSWM